MARILYGVMGNTNGHISRSLAVARALPEHEFYFIGGGRVPEVIQSSYPCLEVPVLRTVHRKQSVSIPAILGQVSARLLEAPRVLHRIEARMEAWQPDLALVDREFYLPLSCHRTGLPMLALNHSGLLLSTRYPVARGQRVSWFLAMLYDRLLFDFTRENWSVSFYQPPLKGRKTDRLFPPLLRSPVRSRSAGEGDHIFVYQTSRTFTRLITALEKWNRPAILYGVSDREETRGALTFRPFDPERMLDDLASCRWAITNGGHNLLCEAFYFGKPVLCFPIGSLFEQFLNSHYVRELGYGDYRTTPYPEPALLEKFDREADRYRENILKNFEDGTEEIIRSLRKRITELVEGR